MTAEKKIELATHHGTPQASQFGEIGRYFQYQGIAKVNKTAYVSQAQDERCIEESCFTEAAYLDSATLGPRFAVND